MCTAACDASLQRLCVIPDVIEIADIEGERAELAAFFRRGLAQPLDLIIPCDDATADYRATDEFLAIGTRFLGLT